MARCAEDVAPYNAVCDGYTSSASLRSAPSPEGKARRRFAISLRNQTPPETPFRAYKSF